MSQITSVKMTDDRVRSSIGNTSFTISLSFNNTYDDVITSINYYGLVYTSFLFMVGLPGNITVFYVYSKKTRKNSTTVFILVLAVFDLINCTATLPTEIVMLLNPFVFHIGPVCKMSRFTTYTCNSSAAVILAAIAVDRYKRVCKPHGKQITLKRAKYMAAMAFIMAVSFTWPSLVIYGPRTVHARTDNENITQKVCEIHDSYVITIYPLIYYSYMCFSTCGIYFILLASYISIVIKMAKRRNFSSLVGGQFTSKRNVPDIQIENPSSHVADCRDTRVVQVSSAHGSTRSLNVCCRTDESNLYQYEPAPVAVIGDIKMPNDNYDNGLQKSEGRCETNDKSLNSYGCSNVDELVGSSNFGDNDNIKKYSISSQEKTFHERLPRDIDMNSKRTKSLLSVNACFDHIDTEASTGTFLSKASKLEISHEESFSNKITLKTKSIDIPDKESCEKKNLSKTSSLDIPLNSNSSDEKAFFLGKCKLFRNSFPNALDFENFRRKSCKSRSPSYTGEISLSGSNKSRMRPSKRSLRTHRLGKTTLMLLVVTVVYIVSFLPFLGVVIQRSINPVVPLTFDEEFDTVYEALYRSYLLNCAINPIIYSFFNANFRKDCRAACRRRKLYYRQ